MIVQANDHLGEPNLINLKHLLDPSFYTTTTKKQFSSRCAKKINLGLVFFKDYKNKQLFVIESDC